MPDAAQPVGAKPTGIAVYTPWIPREGGHVQATFEGVQINSGKTKVDLFTKPKEDGGDGSNAERGKAPPGSTDNGPDVPKP